MNRIGCEEMITMKNIIREGNPLLRQKSSDVLIPLNKEDEKTLVDMCMYLINSCNKELAEKYDLRPGVGLAAPQIGINKNMIVIYAYDESGREFFLPLVNPKLVSHSKEMTYLPGGEGCLSVDRAVEGLIHRFNKITVRGYLYSEGKLIKKTIKLEGYLAVIFQHEFDHLNGVLFIDRVNKENPFYIVENSKPIVFNEEN